MYWFAELLEKPVDTLYYVICQIISYRAYLFLVTVIRCVIPVNIISEGSEEFDLEKYIKTLQQHTVH